jgi:hypothetical protein
MMEREAVEILITLVHKNFLIYHSSRCQWLGSYFSGRIQRVSMGDCVSRDILVTSGVPQASHLGPLCFIWFVNEIARIFRHVRVFFMLMTWNCSSRCVLSEIAWRIQDDLNRLAEWCEANALELNVGKCKSIKFSRLRHPIEFSYMLHPQKSIIRNSILLYYI